MALPIHVHHIVQQQPTVIMYVHVYMYVYESVQKLL